MKLRKLSDIRVCIWDFDGTLYKSVPELFSFIREKELSVIMRHTGWDHAKAEEEFYKKFPVVSPSGTRIVSILSGVPLTQAAAECAENELYSVYLHKEKKLQELFYYLSSYTHYMLVNGGYKSVIRGLTLLGIDPSVFTEIITSEMVGESKPHPKGFLSIIEKTGFPARNHLMIGDRETVDLAPAKALGMQTCLVWSEVPSAISDITLPTVYDIKNVLS